MLIEMGILMGTDYCDNKTVSPNKAYGLIKKYKTVDKIPELDIGHTCDDAIAYYHNPPVYKIRDKNVIRKGNLDVNKLYDYLKKFNFKTKYINKLFLELSLKMP